MPGVLVSGDQAAEHAAKTAGEFSQLEAADRAVRAVGRRRGLFQRVVVEGAALQCSVTPLACRVGLLGRLGGGLLC
ncbi:hypothetical protein [Streptomyces sioyaensis]|uniref:hypothetical protein n=1 Tax=Streptomyces sioyaensis TaxID=67364 RepID=UPI003792B091